MNERLKRRVFITRSALTLPVLGVLSREAETSLRATPTAASKMHDGFPSQPSELVREAVGASHRDFERLRELVDVTPTLARASWDWGFGDWESGLGAASHMGRRDIAEYLLRNGARPNLFSAAMLGQLSVVRALVEASPGIQSIPGPHAIPLLAHAKAGGEEARLVVEYLESIGGANERPESIPLDEESKQVYLGEYSIGPRAQDTLRVQEGKNGLALSRGDGVGRPLAYRGDHVFFPYSSPRVEIRFRVEEGRAVRLQIASAEISLSAHRT